MFGISFLAISIGGRAYGSIESHCENDIKDAYKSEFVSRTFKDNNRKIKSGYNNDGVHVKKISYSQVQVDSLNIGKVKNLVIVADSKRVTNFDFVFGSESFENPTEGETVFKIVSTNILNKSCKSTRFDTKYNLKVTNGFDDDVLDADVEASLNISIDVCYDFDLIEKRYELRVQEQSLDELQKSGINFMSGAGLQQTNELMLKITLNRRANGINEILKEYDSSFSLDINKFVIKPDQFWNEFYISPMKYIQAVCDNTYNHAERSNGVDDVFPQNNDGPTAVRD